MIASSKSYRSKCAPQIWQVLEFFVFAAAASELLQKLLRDESKTMKKKNDAFVNSFIMQMSVELFANFDKPKVKVRTQIKLKACSSSIILGFLILTVNTMTAKKKKITCDDVSRWVLSNVTTTTTFVVVARRKNRYIDFEGHF